MQIIDLRTKMMWWGDTFFIENKDPRHKERNDAGEFWCHGHSETRYKIGDVVITNSNKLNVMKFKIKEINYMANPTDQFFCWIEFVEYLNEKATK